VENDNNVRCVVISGAGSNSAAGLMSPAFASAKPDSVLRFSDYGQTLYTHGSLPPNRLLPRLRRPIGGGLGTGIGLRYPHYEKKAQLRFPEITLGLIPGWGGTSALSVL